MQRHRRLGFGEARMHLMHSLLAGTTQGVRAVRVQGNLDAAAIVRAVAAVKRKYEMLNVAVAQDDGEYVFTLAGGDDGDVTIRPRLPGESWLAAMNQELHVLLDPSRRTWRLVVLTPPADSPARYDLLLVMCHCAMDAGAADSFVDQVLELASRGAPDIVPDQPPAAVPPAAESVCTSACSWDRFLAGQKELAARAAAALPPPHVRAAPLEQRRTVLESVHVGREQCDALDRFCRHRGVSFNSYLSAAVLAAVRDCSPERSRFSLGAAVSLRELCPGVKEDDFGSYLSVVPTFTELADPPATLATLAETHQRAMHKAFMSFARPPSDYPIAVAGASVAKLAESSVFTNDVAVTYSESRLKPSYGDLRLEHAYVAANRTAGNLALAVMALRLRGELFVTIAHVQPLQDSRWAAAAGAALRARLQSPPA